MAQDENGLEPHRHTTHPSPTRDITAADVDMEQTPTPDNDAVTLQRALLSDLDKGTLFNGKYASAPRCLARPGNAATNDEWRLSPKGWKDEQRREDGLK